jgi:hypothetical protein
MSVSRAKSIAWPPKNRLPEPASVDFIRWLHRAFYRDAHEEMLRIRGADREFMMVTGEWRSRPEHDVEVGRHLPPSSERVDAFMRHFESRYRFATMGKAGRIMAIATAHHRLNFIHPFLTGTAGQGKPPHEPCDGAFRRDACVIPMIASGGCRTKPLMAIAWAKVRP